MSKFCRSGAVLLCLFFAGCSPAEKKAGGPPPSLPVTVIEVKSAKVPVSVEAVGQTEGSREAEVRAQVGGILLKKLYAEGASVKAGQPLFQIDPAPYQIAVNDARARAEQTSRESARLKGLVAQQAVSQKEYDDATSADAIAQAALQQAQLNLSYALVKAPISGISGRAVRSEGALIAMSDNLLTNVSQVNPIWVRFSLSESDISELPGGRLDPKNVQGVELTLPDGSVYPVKGHLNFAATQIDTKLGTMQLRAEFDNKDTRILPGQFVRARLVSGQQEGVFLVPQTAVMQSDLGRFVFVVGDKGTAEPRPIKAGKWLGRDWIILDGLKNGDKVIVDNLLKLRPGAPVSPHAPGDKPAGQKK